MTPISLAATQPEADALLQPTALLTERVRLLAEQSIGAATSTFVGALLIALVLISDGSATYVSLWVLAYMGPAVWRVRLSQRLLRGERRCDASARRHYLWIAVFNGVWTGALPVALFADLSIESRIALTVVTLLAMTAGAATFASYRTGYLWMLAMAVPPLVLNWAAYGGPQAWIVVVTLLVYAVMMIRLSRHLAEVFEKSFDIRFEREKVVAQLRQEKMLTEQARQQAEDANRAKSRFLANASHDLRQPAHALCLFTGVLEATALSEQHREIARNIAEASRVLSELLDNLLDISRLDAGIVSVSPQPVVLQSFLERLREDAQRLVGRRPIVVGASADDVVVVVDVVLVERALRNLLDNALKFTTEGTVHLSALARGHTLELSVQDSGCGIPSDQHALIFEEFYQIGNPERDHRKGLGLGLSIVSRLCALMGGSVAMSSQMGKGTTFTLRLPLQFAAHGSAATSTPVAERLDLQGWRVLVIDDEAMVRAGMRELLRSWGAAVDEADGLSSVRPTPSESDDCPWDVCFCDLRLRCEEDGLESALQLRRSYPKLPIVLVTGDTAPQRIEQAARSGLPLLHKPVTPVQLGLAIRQYAGAAHE